MRRFLKVTALALVLSSSVATAAKIRESWAFAWDWTKGVDTPTITYLDADYFELDVIVNGVTNQTVRVNGGTSRTVRDVIVSESVTGVVTAVVRACNTNAAKCSDNSNAVVLDRTPPEPPQFPGYNQR